VRTKRKFDKKKAGKEKGEGRRDLAVIRSVAFPLRWSLLRRRLLFLLAILVASIQSDDII
jgi:hypothetical protein